jgi:NTP pyrophosphatase (non-canonical NTP hydrolase)
MTSIDSLDALRTRLRIFVAEREWEKFHNPKNLVMALIVEAGELVEQFQWLTPHEADSLRPDQRAEVELEIADVLIYLVELADRLGIDPLAAAEKKLALNAVKYPVEKARGHAGKYDKL